MKATGATDRNKYKSKIDAYITKLMKRHPFIAFLMIFIGMPIFILLAVFAVVYLIALPLGFIMGWF